MMSRIKGALSLGLRIAAILLFFGGPVYGVGEMRIEGRTTLSAGAGFVLLTALQRAR